MNKQMKRFQECSWYIRLWRMRHYWYVPFDAIQLWWYNRKDPDMDFSLCWGVGVGTVEMVKMNWYLTHEEFLELLKEE